MPVASDTMVARVRINVDEDLVHRAGAHAFVDDLVELEGEGAGDMVLLPIAHAVPKLRGLAEMVGEAGTPLAHLRPCLLRTATERKAAAAPGACIGQPPPRLLGK